MLKINTITRDSVLCRKENLDTTNLDEDLVMMDLEQGKYYALNSIGGAIWEKIDKPITVRDLILELMEEYSVDENTCYLDIVDFLSSLKDEALVQVN